VKNAFLLIEAGEGGPADGGWQGHQAKRKVWP
jgi:hypothetical protein